MASDEMDPLNRSIARFDEYAAKRRADYEADEDRFGPPEGEPKVEPPKIQAKVFRLVDPKTIPPRPWIYGKHYMRGMVSATAGIGGAGKSTLLLVEALSMALGVDLLNGREPLPLGRIRVWVHNGEDPYEELQRRIGAIAIHYGITDEELGDYFRVTSGRDMPIMMARELSDGGKLLVPTDHGKQIIQEIKDHQIQVFIADPFVTLHRVNENDNVMIDAVMTILRDAANESGAAFEVAHHFRKLNGDEPNVDSLRGASSMVGACRSIRIVSSMSKDESQKYNIPEEERGFYSWLMNGKANMLPPSHKRRWMRMESVGLGNETEEHEEDRVGVATSWEAPELEVALSGNEFRMIRAAVLGADPVRQLRADIRSTGWIGLLIANVMNLDPKDASVKTQMQSVIAKLVANGCLVKDVVRDHVKGRPAPVMRWSKEEDSE
jgi:hypothetical protein